MAFDHVPAVPAPPDDPSSLLMDGRVGWREASSSGVDMGADGVLRLAPLDSSLPPLANPAGTFGNRVLPANVAITPDGTVLLLDRASRQLLRFDACACRFVRVRRGPSPPPWAEPQGIGVRGQSLFVCDPKSECVWMLTLNGLVLRGTLRPPGAKFTHWESYAIAFDHSGRAFVADRSAGLVHRFDRLGRWETALPGFVQPTSIAIDCRNRLFVTITAGMGLSLRVTDGDGTEIAESPRRDELMADFPDLPFEVDTDGNLHLGPLCAPPAAVDCTSPAVPGSSWFDGHGQPMPKPPVPLTTLYSTTGEFVTGPLDSRIETCVWHRVLLRCVVPEGTRLTVSTFTADQPFTADQIAAFATWDTDLRAADGDWDGLVRSAAGRYLWLKLTLASNGARTAEIHRLETEFPRIGSRRYLPAVFGAEPTSADFTDRFLALFDTTMRGIERQIDTQARLFDPASAPSTRLAGAPVDFLSWLASWVGVSLDRRWSEEQRRRFLKAAGGLFERRGTLTGLRQQLDLVLGFDTFDKRCPRHPQRTRCGCPPRNCAPCLPAEPWRRPPLVLEHFRLRKWLYVGAGRLGEAAVLWGNRVVNRTSLDANARVGGSQLLGAQDPLRDPYHVYAHKFSVFVPCRYRDSKAGQRSLETFLKTESPAHTQHELVFVEPRFRIGVQSMIGFDSVVGGVPTGVRLGETRLESRVLTSKIATGSAPFAVGRQGRVGTTTRIG